ncbi:acyl-CoA thioesterase [Tumidithrix elongata RA019]|uniref:1,4-dihydroxy-2-naphthoyl-CoA hydrolase n=1 Tax=Tumidithrix elongata BACA0141 TaxID=2716417 RepID=A0AAW9Q7E0_9CYAN|nr:acyl-CoA thioesterase [Tumidithrix elongata RA019]
MPFTYHRTIRFQDTDAAGVVYFANVLSICHEAYEASLIAVGIDLKSFFRNPNFAIPIAHVDIDFYKPMFCGDRIVVELTPQQSDRQEFEIHYRIFAELSESLDIQEKNSTNSADSKPICKAFTRHVCINPSTRTRAEISAKMEQWLQILN